LALADTTAAALTGTLLALLSAESTTPSLFAPCAVEPSSIAVLKHNAINVKAFEYDMSLNPVPGNGQACALQHVHWAWTKV